MKIRKMKDKKKIKKKKPQLNILWASKQSKDNKTLDFLKLRYDVKVLDRDNLKVYPDLLVFTGGADINPAMYEEQSVGKYTKVDIARDEVERETYIFFNDIPKLGICRGSQFLHVRGKGNLIQHVENHDKEHYISIADTRYAGDYELKMTSTHHQMMNPFDLDEDVYELIAWSTKFQTPTYLDGNNEEIELSGRFLEPEILYMKNNRSLCIQGHPEFKECNKETKNYCLDLIDKYLVNNKEKKEEESRWLK